MTPLEKRGLEAVASDLVGSRALGAVLIALLDANGQPMTVHEVAAIRPGHRDRDSTPSNIATTRICCLRGAMEDVGLGNPIRTLAGGGYVLPADLKQPIIDRLVEAARL